MNHLLTVHLRLELGKGVGGCKLLVVPSSLFKQRAAGTQGQEVLEAAMISYNVAMTS